MPRSSRIACRRMHAPLDDSAAELDPASIHRIERGHPVAGNLRRSLSPSRDCTLCRWQSTAPELSEVDCRTPGGVKATWGCSYSYVGWVWPSNYDSRAHLPSDRLITPAPERKTT